MSFSVSYIIKAVDKYTPTAKSITRQTKKMASSFELAGKKSRLFGKQIDLSSKKLKKYGTKMRRFGRDTALWLGVPMAAVGAASVKAASDMEVVYKKFDRTFSDLDGADTYAKRFMKTYGVIESTAKQIQGNTGDLLVGIGFDPKLAAELSERVGNLSADLFAANAEMTDMSDTAHRLKSGLLGETEGMKALGITVNQNSKEYKRYFREAMRVTRGNQLQAKALAILRFAEEQSVKSIGAFADGAGTLKIELFKTNEQLKRTREIIGIRLTPMIISAAESVTKLSQSFNKLQPGTQTTIIQVGMAVMAFAALVVVLGIVVWAIGVIGGTAAAVIAGIVIGGTILYKFFMGLWELFKNIAYTLGEWKLGDYKDMKFSVEHSMASAPVTNVNSNSVIDVNLSDPGGMVADTSVRSDGAKIGLNRGNGLGAT